MVVVVVVVDVVVVVWWCLPWLSCGGGGYRGRWAAAARARGPYSAKEMSGEGGGC
jgi:hypothetical protein